MSEYKVLVQTPKVVRDFFANFKKFETDTIKVGYLTGSPSLTITTTSFATETLEDQAHQVARLASKLSREQMRTLKWIHTNDKILFDLPEDVHEFFTLLGGVGDPTFFTPFAESFTYVFYADNAFAAGEGLSDLAYQVTTISNLFYDFGFPEPYDVVDDSWPVEPPVASIRPDDETTNIRTVILGFTAEGERCVLEWVSPRADAQERLRYWQSDGMADPYSHDIHVAVEQIVTTYERV